MSNLEATIIMFDNTNIEYRYEYFYDEFYKKNFKFLTLIKTDPGIYIKFDEYGNFMNIFAVK